MIKRMFPINAKYAVRIWQAALCIGYAAMALQLFSLLRTTNLHGTERLVTMGSLIVGGLLVVYLHLKLSVSADDRNRLARLKKEAPFKQKGPATIAYEHMLLAQMLVKSGVLSLEEVQQAQDLSLATHSMLGHCLVSFDWITSEHFEEALVIQERVRSGDLSAENAIARLSEFRVERHLAFQKQEYAAPRSAKPVLTKFKKKKKKVEAEVVASEDNDEKVGYRSDEDDAERFMGGAGAHSNQLATSK